MDVRMKFGRYNGTVRDVDPVAGRAMLLDGRAELPCPDQGPSMLLGEQVAETTSELNAKVSTKGKRK